MLSRLCVAARSQTSHLRIPRDRIVDHRLTVAANSDRGTCGQTPPELRQGIDIAVLGGRSCVGAAVSGGWRAGWAHCSDLRGAAKLTARADRGSAAAYSQSACLPRSETRGRPNNIWHRKATAMARPDYSTLIPSLILFRPMLSSLTVKFCQYSVLLIPPASHPRRAT